MIIKPSTAAADIASVAAGILALHGFVQEDGNPYFTLWLREKAAYVTAMSSGEGAPKMDDFALYFSVSDGMEGFYDLLSSELTGANYMTFGAACASAARLNTSFLPDGAFAPILDKEDAVEWITAMFNAECLYHFDDDPRTIVWDNGRDLSELEARLLDHQVDMIFVQAHANPEFDPYAIAVDLIGAADKART